jgi:hypothetical protein
MSWANGEFYTLLSLPTPFMFYIPFRRSLGKRDVKTSSLRGNGTGSLEISNEFNNHEIERKRVR